MGEAPRVIDFLLNFFFTLLLLMHTEKSVSIWMDGDGVLEIGMVSFLFFFFFINPNKLAGLADWQAGFSYSL